MTDTPALLPCPFCGGEAYYTRSVSGSAMHYVGCSPCGIHFRASEVYYPDPTRDHLTKDIIAGWNTRTPSVSPPVDDERVKSIRERRAKEYGHSFTETRGTVAVMADIDYLLSLLAARPESAKIQQEVERLRPAPSND